MGKKPKVVQPEIIKDSKDNILKEDDWCLFWNDDENKKVKYQFYDWYDRPNAINSIEHHYISIDIHDNNDLSWWKNCEKIMDNI